MHDPHLSAYVGQACVPFFKRLEQIEARERLRRAL
jgi:hypothetical protein